MEGVKGVMGEGKLTYVLTAMICILIIFELVKYFRRKKEPLIVASVTGNKAYLINALIFIPLAFFYLRNIVSAGLNNYLNILAVITYPLMVFILIYRGVEKNAITLKGINTSIGSYEWKRITRYEWGFDEDINIKNINIRYSTLIFHIKPSKLDIFFYGDNRRVVFKLYKEDRERIQDFLNKVLTKTNINIMNNNE